jgi:hypothetical protein
MSGIADSTCGNVDCDSTLGMTTICRTHAAMLTEAKNRPTRTARSESKGTPRRNPSWNIMLSMLEHAW